MSAFESSPYRCRYDGKLMIQEMGQEDEDEATIGWVRIVHSCLHCGHSFREEHAPDYRKVRVLTPTRSGLSASERLYKLRNGTFQEVLDGAS